ncbi:MAG: MBOAT family O-acyltransferase [Pseudomonadota bacterium]
MFLPATLLAFYAAPARWRVGVLVAASLIFYGVSGTFVLAAFLFSIAWGFSTAFLFGRIPKGWAIAISIVGPFFFLVMFKYLNFILDTAHAGAQTRDLFEAFLSITLPAGISFYTFELVSYSIDVADGRTPRETKLLRFAGFATFFPHLIAGPIMRYHDLRDQLAALGENAKLQPNIVGGLKFLAIGIFAKVFVADLSGIAVEQAQAVSLGERTALDQSVQIAFWSMQIYYDFWAYSIMAIGLGRLFCIELPVNFREPYMSENPREFWRRWHVTLSYWLRDYAYIKLGGNKAYVRNIIIVFAAVGLWHGAGWNFVAWGLYHAALVVGYHFAAPLWDRLPRVLTVTLTFVLVSLGWPLFFLSFSEYAAFLAHFASAPAGLNVYSWVSIAYLAALLGFTFLARERYWLHNDREHPNAIADSPYVVAALAFVGLVSLSLSKTFIYFRF